MEIIVVDKESFEKKKQKFKNESENTFIITDFNRTLTKTFKDNKKLKTSFAQIREGNYLGKDYAGKANALFAQYYPIEKDPLISKEEKVPQLVKWWKEHLQLMVEYNLTKENIRDSIMKNTFAREGLEELINYTNEKEIPFVIISSGLGNIADEFLKMNDLRKENVSILSNMVNFSKEKATGIGERIIVPFNKDKVKIDLPEVKERKNIILIGDDLFDLDLIKKADYSEVLKIGFLNSINKVDEKVLNQFKENFDLIITRDGSLEPVNQLLKELFD